MQNLIVAAVALLSDIPCVVLAESVQPDADLLKKCEEEGIFLLGSDKSAFELALAFEKAHI